MKKILAALIVSTIVLSLVGCAEETEPKVAPEGRELNTKEEGLKAGAEILQGNAPTDKLDIYLVGFHPMSDAPSHQMEAHHFCYQVNKDFAQCVLFDSNDENANLNGIEYIISEKRFEALPEREKQYWHPHNYEILSGQLIAPGIPELAEHELMEGKMNSYGKTWHVWQTGSAVSEGQDFPYGEPHLAWSFNADGQAKEGLIEARDEAMDVSTEQTRANRQDLVDKANPQRGVDRLDEEFPNRKKPKGIEAK